MSRGSFKYMADIVDQRSDDVAGSGDVSLLQDVLVTTIVALIGTAIALGLYLQIGLSVAPALSIGSGVFIWLLSLHFLVTRMRLKRLIDGRLARLSGDVTKLKKEAEITDLLAEGHNELLEGQGAIENALRVIVERIDQYDDRLKVLDKVGQDNKAQLDINGQNEDGTGIFEMQSQLKRLSGVVKDIEYRFDKTSQEQLHLLRAELDVLEFVVKKMSLTAAGDDDALREKIAQKALKVISGLRRLPVLEGANHLGNGTVDQRRDGIDRELSSGLYGEALPAQISSSLNEVSLEAAPFVKTAELAPSVSKEIEPGDGDQKSAVRDRRFGQKSSLDQKETLLATINEAIGANRIELYMQPIVGLPDRDLVFYEAFSRLRNDVGQVLLPADFMVVADQSGLTPIIDNQIILRAVQVVERLVSRDKGKVVFCNLAIGSISDAEFFAEFMDFMEANQWLSKYLVFEFTQKSIDELGGFEFERLKAVSDLGFTFSMDQVTRLDIDFKALSELKFRYIKISAELLLGNVASAKAEIHPADFNSYLHRLDITMIVDKVEREPIVRQLRDYNVSYAQGTLFCEPKPVRPEVFEQQIVEVA